MRASNGACACFRQPEVLDLAFANQALHGTRDVFDGDVRINTVLVEEVDPIGLEPFQPGLSNLADVRRASADTSSPLVPNRRFCIPCSFVTITALLDDLHLSFVHSTAVYREIGEGTIDLLQIVGCQSQAGGLDIFVEVREFSGARNRNDEGLLSQ